MEAPFKIGRTVATSGSRAGKSSFRLQLLRQLAERGEEATGIFLVDWRASLADGFLGTIDQLPGSLRAQAIRWLRVITPTSRK